MVFVFCQVFKLLPTVFVFYLRSSLFEETKMSGGGNWERPDPPLMSLFRWVISVCYVILISCIVESVFHF